MTSFSGVTFVLFCFVFVFMFITLKPQPFVQPSYDMQAPRSRTCFYIIIIVVIWRCRFFRVFFCTISASSLYEEYVVRSFLPNGVFLPSDHGLDFLHQLI